MSNKIPGYGAAAGNGLLTRCAMLAFAIGVSSLVVGCSGDDDDDNSASAQLRVIHGSPDAPPVNIKIDGEVSISDLGYAESTGYVSVEASVPYDIAVEGIIPGGNQDVITVDDFELAEGDRTTVIAVDAVADIEPLVVSESAAEPGSDEVGVTVVHASPAADGATATVDVYVTDPSTDINSAAPALSFAYREDVDAGTLPAGMVRVRATVGGTKTVVYDSGSVDLGPFAGQQLMIVALDTTTPTTQAASPVKLLVATDSAALVLYDANTATGARVIHASPDAGSVAGGPVEVFASSSALPTSPTELIDAFAYADIVPAADTHVAVPAGDYVFDVAPDTDTIGDSVYTSDATTLEQGAEYTLVAAGRVASSPAFTLLASADNSRSIATQASVKVMHAAPAAGTVEVYVTGAGDFSVADVENGLAGDPLLSNFEFGDITDYVSVEPGNYDVRVVAGGVVAINIEALNLAAGSVSTVVARGPIEPSGTPDDFSVILLTN